MAVLRTFIALAGKADELQAELGSGVKPAEASNQVEAQWVAALEFFDDLAGGDRDFNPHLIDSWEQTDDDGVLIGWDVHYC